LVFAIIIAIPFGQHVTKILGKLVAFTVGRTRGGWRQRKDADGRFVSSSQSVFQQGDGTAPQGSTEGLHPLSSLSYSLKSRFVRTAPWLSAEAVYETKESQKSCPFFLKAPERSRPRGCGSRRVGFSTFLSLVHLWFSPESCTSRFNLVPDYKMYTDFNGWYTMNCNKNQYSTITAVG
jgi:hypothetical protein